MPKKITVTIEFDDEASWFLSYKKLGEELDALEEKGSITGWQSSDDEWFNPDDSLLHEEDISTIRMRART